MTVAVYDPERHHIGLGPAAGSSDPRQGENFGYLISGYNRIGQRFGSPTDFGGERDLIGNPTLSRWTMDDFTGGCYSYTWGKDAAMFASSLNIIPSEFDRSVRSVPPLLTWATKNFGGALPLWVGASDGWLFAVFADGIHGWALDGGWYTHFTTLGDTQANTPRAACWDRNQKRIAILFDAGVINFYNIDGTLSQSYGAAPIAAGSPGSGIILSQSDLVFACNNYLWKVAMPETGTPIDTDFLKLGRLPGQWIAAVALNGFVYIICARKDAAPILVQWAGSTGVLPVCEFPYNFQPDCIAAYGGRIYVGGSGRDFSGGNNNAELYEVTGASLRLVRTFGPESEGAASASKPKSVYDLAVHEGLLVFGDTGRSLVAYDLTSDGFFGSSQLQPPDGIREFRKLLPYRDTVYAWINHPLDHNQDGWYRVCRSGSTFDIPAASFDGVLVTSDFSPEPDRQKRWSHMKILSRYGHVTVGYSLTGGAPGGDTFTDLPTTSESHGDVRITTADLSGIPPSTAIRLRIKMPRGTVAQGFTELVAFTVGFVFLDTGKWAWQFTVNGTERVESRADDTEKQNVHDIRTELTRYWRDRVPLTYTDVDGSQYTVQLTSLHETQPVIGPESGFVNPDLTVERGREAFYAVTLTEV